VGAGRGGGSWAKAEETVATTVAAATNVTKNQKTRDEMCRKVFIVMYYITK
jgi:hypothetical protein